MSTLLRPYLSVGLALNIYPWFSIIHLPSPAHARFNRRFKRSYSAKLFTSSRRSFNSGVNLTVITYIHASQEITSETIIERRLRSMQKRQTADETSGCQVPLEDLRGRRDSLYHAVTVDWNLQYLVSPYSRGLAWTYPSRLSAWLIIGF